MTSGCGDVLNLQDLQVAKKNQIFEAEVITGKEGGTPSGVDIENATNQNTGQIQKTMPAIMEDLEELYTTTSGQQQQIINQLVSDSNAAISNAEAYIRAAVSSFGYITVDSFENGATISEWNQVLRLESTGVYYRWDGSLPKVVSPGSSPSSSGGVGAGAWLSVLDATLMTMLSSSEGASSVGSSLLHNVQQDIKMQKPYKFSGTFALGAEISSEYDTLYSHTDTHGNEYWYSYIGTSTLPFTVPPASSPDKDWTLVISDDFTCPLQPEVNVTSVTAVTSTDVTYTVSNSASFVVGNYALIYSSNRLGQWHCGVFKVLEKTSTSIKVQQQNAKITTSGNTLLGSCSVRAMNDTIYSPGGVTVNGFVSKISGFIFDGQALSRYGIYLGGGHNNTGIKRNQASVGSMSYCAFVNLNTSGATSDDTVGILIASGSSMGVMNVAVNGTKIGIETYRNGSLIGLGAYVYNASNDAFKAEFTCNNYLYYCAAIKCGSGFTARYSAGGEYATIVCSDASYGVLSQFNAYCSVRDYEFYGMTSAGCYATQESYLLINNGTLTNCSYTYRARKGGQIEQLSSATSVIDIGSINGYDITSSRLFLLNATVSSGVQNSWDGVGYVNINAVDHGFVSVTLSATVPAGGRSAWQAQFQFNFNETSATKVRLGVRYSDSALPAGILIPTPSLFNANSSRLYAVNYTSSPIVLSMTAFAYVY